MAFCPQCGAESASGARFCAQCGHALAAGCANCGAELAPGARFCAQCGTPVAGAAPPTDGVAPATSAPPPPAPPPVAPPAAPAAGPSGPPAVQGRKKVTMLFCDVQGSTAMGEALDPESIRN